jgi:formylglycine-generating enzyme required for sulfatase activity
MRDMVELPGGTFRMSAARQSETVDTSTCHIGFRCVVRPGS